MGRVPMRRLSTDGGQAGWQTVCVWMLVSACCVTLMGCANNGRAGGQGGNDESVVVDDAENANGDAGQSDVDEQSDTGDEESADQTGDDEVEAGQENMLLVSFPASTRVVPSVRDDFAIAKDDSGDQFLFRGLQVDEDVQLSEIDLRLVNGQAVKLSLDTEGRPVKLRSSENENADISYSKDGVRIRYSPAGSDNGQSASGGVSFAVIHAAGDASNEIISIGRGRANVRQQMQTDGGGENEQPGPADSTELDALLAALARLAEQLATLLGADSPLVGTQLEEALRLLMSLGGEIGAQEVAVDALEDVFIGDPPAELLAIAGATFHLMEVQGSCVGQTGIASRLTFDERGVLQSEFDRRLVFQQFNNAGGDGFDIDYVARTPIELVSADDGLGVGVVVTPIYAGTQVDQNGELTVERRFRADVDFDDALTGGLVADFSAEFNAALIDGRLVDDGNEISFSFVQVDLAADVPVERVSRLRYVRDVAIADDAAACDVMNGSMGIVAGLDCPSNVNALEPFDVQYMTRESTAGVAFQWYIVDGAGIVTQANDADAAAEIVATADGVLRVGLIVSDPAFPSPALYACAVGVGEVSIGDASIECPTSLPVGQAGAFSAGGEGALPSAWFVVGTSAYDIAEPFAPTTDITFWKTGRFEVAAVMDAMDGGASSYAICQVAVTPPADEDVLIDRCAEMGYYGDGVCDAFCPLADVDCPDMCMAMNLYDDGICDDCIEHDDDCGPQCVVDDNCMDGHRCDGGRCVFVDACADQGRYGDYVCDEDCAEPDPDCSDPCVADGRYTDGLCDPFCRLPDLECDCFDDNDCLASEACCAGDCIPIAQFQCAADADCQGGQVCVNCGCVSP